MSMSAFDCDVKSTKPRPVVAPKNGENAPLISAGATTGRGFIACAADVTRRMCMAYR